MPMADSQLILELLFLHIKGGCSLAVLLFSLMLVGTCCFALSASLCIVRPKYRASHRHESVVYEFSCRCEARYAGRTTKRLADRIKQHVPTASGKKEYRKRSFSVC